MENSDSTSFTIFREKSTHTNNGQQEGDEEQSRDEIFGTYSTSGRNQGTDLGDR
jgi:hypothetical protein